MLHFRRSALTISVLCVMTATSAHAENQLDGKKIDNRSTDHRVLPKVTVGAEQSSAYAASKASSILKSDASLFETAQSISVITREQLDQKQASTLPEALSGVAGVVAGALGRRGWDDFIIRGQTSSDQVFIDGLRQGAGTYVAAEISGMDQVQILKGPASVNFGLVQPGGMVNLVTKRPQADIFYRADLAYGSYGLKQGSFDLNHSPNGSGKGAFRINGRIADQDDPTRQVYFKNYYISPSYNFDLGDKAELSVIASYQHREYLRQQGLPTIGSLLPNPNGQLARDLFIGEPSHGAYDADVYRAGYTFKYALENGWNVNQNFAAQKTEMIGPAVFYNGWSDAEYTTLKRQARYQNVDNLNFAIDNSLQKILSVAGMEHDLSIGIDGLQDKNDYVNNRCSVPNLNLYSPRYGMNVSCPATATNHDINRLRYVGVYARNRIYVNERLIVNLAGRHDWAETSTQNIVRGTFTNQYDQAFTGSTSVLYTLNDYFAPYVSYATSFFPTSGTDYFGNAFKPEEGEQIEAGVKLQSADQKVQGSVAWYDLRRQNVTTSDLATGHEGFSVQRGEQMTRGVETELSAELLASLRLTASYTYTSDAEVSEDSNTSNIGVRLNNIPKHAYSLSARYRPTGDDSGWYIGAGIRGESYKTMQGLDAHIPAYTLFDAEAGYDAQHWGAQLSLRNLFNKNYYAGALNANMMTLGNPRQINLAIKFKY